MGSPLRSTVIFDASPLRYLRTGLGQFAYQLLTEFSQVDTGSLDIRALVHPAFMSLVPSELSRIPASWLRRHSPPVLQQFLYPPVQLWHMTTENTRMTGVPDHAKIILTIHGLHFLDEEPAEIAQKELKKVQRLVNRAHAITTVSHFTAELVKRKLRLDGKPLEVIHNGIFHGKSSGKRPSWAPSGKFFFSVGTFFARKNFQALLPMMQLMPAFQLVLAGDHNRPYGKMIVEEIHRLNLDRTVIVPGEITEDEKYWLYENGEALLFPSLSEGFGIPVIEALAMGTPVFSSRSGSLPEVGQHYANYWDHFDPEYMARVVEQNMETENPEKRLRRVDYARGFSWQRTAKQYLNFYRSVISSVSPGIARGQAQNPVMV